ncbi:hypothetical protein [Croceivirga radicis]|nr:hypothetical protein [Croceivirga radicis]
MKKNRRIAKVMVFIIGILIISCSKPSKFDSHMISVSENGYGVLVTKIIQHNTPEVPEQKIKDSVYVTSSIPGAYDNTTSLRSSLQIPQSKLPNFITFEYQFMDLSDCSFSRDSKIVKLIFLKNYSPHEKGDIIEASEEKADFFIKKGKGKIATLASVAGKGLNIIETIEQYQKELKTSKLFQINSGCKKWTAIDSLKFTKTIDLRPYTKAKEIKRFRERNKNTSGGYYGTRITYQFYDNGDIRLGLENYTTNTWK